MPFAVYAQRTEKQAREAMKNLSNNRKVSHEQPKCPQEAPQASQDASRGCRVAVIEDDPAMGDLLIETLADAGYHVTGYFDPEHLDLEKLFDGQEFDVVVTDICMPWVDGFAILDYIKSNHRRLPVILITALGESTIHEIADKLGANSILDKPFEMSSLIDAVNKALESNRNTY